MAIYELTAEERKNRAIAAKQQREARYARANFIKAYKDATVEQKKAAKEAQQQEEEERKSKGFLVRGLSTVGNLLGNVGVGEMKATEGLVDLGATAVGAVGGLFSRDFQEDVKDFVAKDFSEKILGNPLNELTRYSYTKDNSVGQIAEEVAQGVGQMLPAVAATVITMGAAAPASAGAAGAAGTAAGTGAGVGAAAATKAAERASLAVLTASAAGNATEEAYKDGAGYGEGLLYGLASGAVEAATEKMWGGFGRLTGGGFLDNITKSAAQTGIRRVAKEALQEGAEEVVSELASPALKTIYKGRDALSEYKTGDYWKGVANAGLVGGLTSVVYGGTVGKGMNKARGMNQDLDAVAEHLSELSEKRNRLFEEGKWTAEEKNENISAQKEDLNKIEMILLKSSEKNREKLISNYNLQNIFEEDGRLKEEIAGWLDASAANDGRYISPGLEGRQEEISQKLAEHGTAIYAGELTESEQRNYTKLKRAWSALSEKGVVSTEFVLTAPSVDFNGFLSGNVIAIGKDALEREGGWAQVLAHEAEHFSEGSAAWVNFADFILLNTDIEKAEQEVIDEYFSGDETIARSAAEAILKRKDFSELSNDEQTYLKELIAKKSEELFGSEEMIKRLAQKKPSLAKRILKRIREFIKVLSASKENRATVIKLQAAEQLFDEALSKAGMRYANEQIKKEDQFSRKTKTFDETKRTPSEGQVARAVADHTRERVFSREDVGKIVDRLTKRLDASDEYDAVIGELRGKSREQIVTELWKALNTGDPGERGGIALDVADLILENAVIKEVIDDSANGENLRIVSAMKTYFHNINLDRIKGDIRQRFGKDNSRFALWGRRKGTKGVTADMVAQELEKQGIRLNVESANEADLFMEVDRMYRQAKEALRKETKQKFKNALLKEEVKEHRQIIAQEILKAFDEGGKQSFFQKFNDSNFWAEKYRNEKYRNEALRELDYEQQKMKDLKQSTYLNATEYRGDTFSKTVEPLAGVFAKGKLNEVKAREAVKTLHEWYLKSNPMFEGDAFNEDIAERLDELSLREDNQQFTVKEIRDLTKIMAYLRHFAETFEKVRRNGKWVEAKPLAEGYIDKQRKAKEVRVGILELFKGKTKSGRRKLGSVYADTFFDPMTRAKMMDGYVEGGFYTEMLEDLKEGTIKAAAENMETLRDYRAFNDKNKKYLKNAERERVDYRGQKITKTEAIYLWMLYKRPHAQAGLLVNGFSYVGADGKTVRPNGVISDAKYSSEELAQYARQEQKMLEQLFTQEDKEYIKILEKGYKAAKKIKVRQDLNKYGYTNVSDEYYVPISRAYTGAKSVDSEQQQEYDRVSNASFNKDTVQGAKQELKLQSADAVFRRHVKAVCDYGNLADIVDAYDKIYNISIIDNKNKPTSVRTESTNVWTEGENYFKKLFSDVQGAGSIKGKSALVSAIRSSYATFQLGANPKTWVTQLSSIFASSSILDFDSISKGLTVSGKDVDKYCVLAELRNMDDTAAMAQGLFDSAALEKMSDFKNSLMKPIGMMDRFVVKRLFGACQVQVEKEDGLKVGTWENKAKAGEMLTKVILETQQNSMATERSAAMRSGSEFLKAITMFSADSMKVTGRVIDSIGELLTLKARERRATGAEKEALKKKLGIVEKKARKSVSALVGSAIFMAAIARLFQKIYGKKSEEPEKEFAVEAVGNLFGGLPLIKDIYAYLGQGYELKNYTYSTINEMLETATDLTETVGAAFSGDLKKQDVGSSVKKLIFAAGAFCGVPVRNMHNVLYGALKFISPETAYKYDGLIYTQYYRDDLKDAIEKGDDDMADTILGLMMDERVGTVKDDKARKTLNELTKAGYSVLPKSIGKTVTYNGEEIMMTAKQKKRFKSIYGTASEAVNGLVKLQQFGSADQETKAKAIKFVYNTYYNLALEEVIGERLESKNTLFAEAIEIEQLAIIIATARSFTADTDRNGNAVVGSKKAKIERYVESLHLPAAQKYMIMGYLGYANKNGKAQVTTYINNLNLTKDEKAELMEYSGY